MKKLILMAIATLVVSTAWAQNEKGTFSIKPMAGINVTGFSGGIVEGIYHYKVRFTAGLEAEYACNNWLGGLTRGQTPCELRLEKKERNTILKQLCEYGANIRQISRVTGISYGVIYRAKNGS